MWIASLRRFCRNRILWLIWTLLTAMSAAICSVGCFLPFWICGHFNVQNGGGHLLTNLQNLKYQEEANFNADFMHWNSQPSELISSIGIFRRCGFLVYNSPFESPDNFNSIIWTSLCGYYPSLSMIPHRAWQASFIFLVTASIVLTFLAFFVLCAGVSLEILYRLTIRKSCMYAYIAAGLFCLLSCFLYPFGWGNNPEIQQICGQNSGTFRLGTCEVGWAFVLTISGGVISLAMSVMPTLFSVYRNRAHENADKLNPKHPNEPHNCGEDRWSSYPLLSFPIDTSVYYAPQANVAPPSSEAVLVDSSGLHKLRPNGPTARRINKAHSGVLTRSCVFSPDFSLAQNQHRLSMTASMFGIPETSPKQHIEHKNRNFDH